MEQQKERRNEKVHNDLTALFDAPVNGGMR